MIVFYRGIELHVAKPTIHQYAVYEEGERGRLYKPEVSR